MALTNNFILVNTGDGARRLATFEFTEDSIVKQLQRVVHVNHRGDLQVFPVLNTGNSLYSNVFGDFVVTPIVGQKKLTIEGFVNADFENIISSIHLLYGLLRVRIDATGEIRDIPIQNFTFVDNMPTLPTFTLTLPEMTFNFAANDTAALILNGPLKNYDIVTDTVKTPYMGYETDAVASYKGSNYIVIDGQRFPVYKADISLTDTGKIVDSLGAARVIRVIGMFLSPGADVNIKFQTRNTANTTQADKSSLYYLKNGVTPPPYLNEFGFAETLPGQNLWISMSTPAALGGHIHYVQI